MQSISPLRTYLISVLFFLLILSIHSIKFFNIWDLCVDVSVEENIFPLSLVQSSKYYQVCPNQDEHWQRFGPSEFRMHILRTSEPFVDKTFDLKHNGYVHLHNQTRQTGAKWYGASHQEL